MKDEDDGKTEVSLFGSGASVNLRKSLYLKTGVDIEEFSEESKHRIKQATPRKESVGAPAEPPSEGNMSSCGVQDDKQETEQSADTVGETGRVIALSEDKVNEIFIQEMQRLSSLSMRNSYNRGIISNLWEIFFPISLRKTLRPAPPHTKAE